MKENLMPFKNSVSGKLVFFLTIIVAYYWFLGQVTDVYRFEVVGAVYEILWLPVLVMLFVLPVIALVLLIKEKRNIWSLNIYSLLIGVVTVLCMIFGK